MNVLFSTKLIIIMSERWAYQFLVPDPKINLFLVTILSMLCIHAAQKHGIYDQTLSQEHFINKIPVLFILTCQIGHLA